jgi:undecaprenyl pyrophosphate synthase
MRSLLVTPFDKGMIKEIEKGLYNAEFTPNTLGTAIRINMPPPTEERRKELAKQVQKEGEGAKIAIRNIRQDANKEIAKLVKDKAISEDEKKRGEDDIQKLTDANIKDVDKVVADKEKNCCRSEVDAFSPPPLPAALPATLPSSWMAMGAGHSSAVARVIGHRAGARAVNRTIERCLELGIPALTLFAFSSENWGRPQEEVDALMKLFLGALDREVDELHRRGVRVRFIGERERFGAGLVSRMQLAEQRTADNTTLTLSIAASYGGRQDIAAPRAWPSKWRPVACCPSRSTNRCWAARSPLPTCRRRICSSAPAATPASATSCCGSWPTPSCGSPRPCGRTSMPGSSSRRWTPMPAASVVSA